MTAQLIDGKALAASIRERIGEEVASLVAQTGIRPGLAAILVGDDPASAVYVKNKKAACAQAGVHVQEHRLPASTKQDDLLALIEKVNADPLIHGVLVQLPLPSHIEANTVLESVAPEKDADGFHPYNMGRLVEGNPLVVPCTPKGVMKMVRATGQTIEGKRAVVLGRSNIVGKPVALLLLQANATVTICHSRTQNLAAVCREADILVAAIGRAQFVSGEMIKDGAIVIDVGINRSAEGRLVGDVEFAAVRERAGWLTPVPGGVGPMTIAMLLENTLEAARRQAERQATVEKGL